MCVRECVCVRERDSKFLNKVVMRRWYNNWGVNRALLASIWALFWVKNNLCLTMYSSAQILASRARFTPQLLYHLLMTTLLRNLLSLSLSLSFTHTHSLSHTHTHSLSLSLYIYIYMGCLHVCLCSKWAPLATITVSQIVGILCTKDWK